MSENPLHTGARVGNFPLEMAKIATDWLLQPQDLAACCLLGHSDCGHDWISFIIQMALERFHVNHQVGRLWHWRWKLSLRFFGLIGVTSLNVVNMASDHTLESSDKRGYIVDVGAEGDIPIATLSPPE